MKTLLRVLGVAAVLAAATAAQAHDYDYPPQMPPPGAELIAPAPPPPLRYEPVPPPPPRRGEVVVWQPGRWHWEARRHDWVWVPGAYVERPYRDAAWEPGHWIERHHEWVWIPGRWR